MGSSWSPPMTIIGAATSSDPVNFSPSITDNPNSRIDDCQHTLNQPPSVGEGEYGSLTTSLLLAEQGTGAAVTTGYYRQFFRDSQLLDLTEMTLSGFSTVVGTPITPNTTSCFGLHHLQEQPSCSLSQTNRGAFQGTIATKSGELGQTNTPRPLSNSENKASSGGGALIHGASWKSTSLPTAWEPHVSVAIDEISLESFTEHSTLDSRHVKSDRELIAGTRTPASDIRRSSNNSIVTLLEQNERSVNSSTSTLFGGFLSKSKSISHSNKLLDLESQAEQIISPGHQAISMTPPKLPDGKVYSQRPKPKQIGKKSSGGSGGGGNGDRKALFSNERTFIHWIKLGILLGTTALTLCNYGIVESLAFHVGIAVLVVAMGALAYAAVIFHRRDRSLARRLQATLARKKAKNGGITTNTAVRKSFGMDTSAKFSQEICYYDRVGPTIICSVLLLAYSINFYLSITRAASVNKDGGLYFFHQD